MSAYPRVARCLVFLSTVGCMFFGATELSAQSKIDQVIQAEKEHDELNSTINAVKYYRTQIAQLESERKELEARYKGERASYDELSDKKRQSGLKVIDLQNKLKNLSWSERWSGTAVEQFKTDIEYAKVEHEESEKERAKVDEESKKTKTSMDDIDKRLAVLNSNMSTITAIPEQFIRDGEKKVGELAQEMNRIYRSMSPDEKKQYQDKLLPRGMPIEITTSPEGQKAEDKKEPGTGDAGGGEDQQPFVKGSDVPKAPPQPAASPAGSQPVVPPTVPQPATPSAGQTQAPLTIQDLKPGNYKIIDFNCGTELVPCDGGKTICKRVRNDSLCSVTVLVGSRTLDINGLEATRILIENGFLIRKPEVGVVTTDRYAAVTGESNTSQTTEPTQGRKMSLAEACPGKEPVFEKYRQCQNQYGANLERVAKDQKGNISKKDYWALVRCKSYRQEYDRCVKIASGETVAGPSWDNSGSWRERGRSIPMSSQDAALYGGGMLGNPDKQKEDRAKVSFDGLERK